MAITITIPQPPTKGGYWESFWDVILECLVGFHGKTYEEAYKMVVAFKARLREGGDEVVDIAYHDDPFSIANALTGNKLDFHEHRKAYNKIRREHGYPIQDRD